MGTKMWCLKVVLQCFVLLLLGVRGRSSIAPDIDTATKSTVDLKALSERNSTDTARLEEVRSERRVYLEDVFYSLKNQNWEKEEQLCLNQTLDMLKNLQNFTLWAVSMWDSIASEPRGMLYGTRHQLGNFDECLKPTWASEQHPHLTTQYCLADVQLLQKPRNVPKYKIDFSPYQSALDKIYYTGDPSRRPLDVITWGTCVPAACAPQSVSRLLTALLQRSSLGVAGIRFNVTVDPVCQQDTSAEPYPTAAVGFFSLFGILSVIVIICTTIHWYYKNISENKNEVSAVMQSFSLLKNLSSLSKKNDSGLDALYGIRYLSICFVVTSHRYAVFSGSALSNGWESDQFYQNPISIFFVHDDLLVDTFFLMSGLLVTKSLLTMERFPNAFVLVFRRYMRLAPGLAAVLFYMGAVYTSAGTGPLWARSVAYEVPPCQENWWVNLLMISNYFRVNQMCIVTTWYIPCDFHFFLMAMWLCYLARHSLRRLAAAAAPLAILSLVVPGVITAYYRLPAVLLFFNSFVVDPRGDETFQRMYIPSHTRFAPYLVGVGMGYLVTKLYPISKTNKMSMTRSTLVACAGLLVMAAVMVTGSVFYVADRQYEPVEAAMYAAFNRPAWALAVAAVVLCCVYGTVPLVSSILCWSPWVPLSKLAYGLYLTHMIIIARDVQVARDPRLYDTIVLIHRATGDIAWGTLAALILWLLVEAPVGNLLSICLAPRSAVAPARKSDNTEKVTDSEDVEVADDSQFPMPSGAHVPQPSDILRSKC